MTSVMQGVLFNLRNYFFRTVPQEVCFSQKPDSITIDHSKFLFPPEIQGNYLILALARDPIATNLQ